MRLGFTSLHVGHQEERGVNERETAQHQNETVYVERILQADEFGHRRVRIVATGVKDLQQEIRINWWSFKRVHALAESRSRLVNDSYQADDVRRKCIAQQVREENLDGLGE